jgi:hypothetical protein
MTKSPEVRFFILNSIGIALTFFAFIVSPTTSKVPIFWMIISMGLFWAVDRIVHALGRAPNETERDGVIWLIPIALGWIPLIILWFGFIPDKYRLISAVGAYCITSYIFVTLFRPESKGLASVYQERSGMDAVKNIFGLFKYRLNVYDSSSTQIKSSGPRAPSYSYAFYNICFGLTAFFVSTKEILNDNGYMLAFVGILFAGMTFVIDKTLNTEKAKLKWDMPENARIILCGLFGISTLNIVLMVIISLIK